MSDSKNTRFRAMPRFFRVVAVAAKRYCLNQNSQRAVTLTYYSLFAIVPIAALLFGIAKGFDIENMLKEVLLEKFSTHQELMQLVYQFADTTLKQASGGVVAGAGIIVLIWTVVSLASNVENAFNSVWSLPQHRNLLRKFSDYVTVILLTPILLVVLSSAGMVANNLLKLMGEHLPVFAGITTFVLDTALMLIPFALSSLLFTLIYYLIPNTRVKWRSALFAGLFTGIAYQLFQNAFIYLQKSIYSYNRIYGSFAALPLFLIWLQWSWQIVLFGAEVGFVAQKLHTGLFDKTRSQDVSPRIRRIGEIALAAVIYRNFEKGLGASSFSELAERTELSAIALHEELSVLLEAGIILKAADSTEACYLPALPPEKTTVLDCCRRLDQPDGLTPVFGVEDLIRAQEVLGNFDKIQGTSQSNCKIFEL